MYNYAISLGLSQGRTTPHMKLLLWVDFHQESGEPFTLVIRPNTIAEADDTDRMSIWRLLKLLGILLPFLIICMF